MWSERAKSSACASAGRQPGTQGIAMKQGIHPDYRDVVFVDVSNGFQFITRSTVQTRETIKVDGKEYPLFKCDVTSETHPFYTGAQNKVLDTAGRIDKFNQKFGKLTGKKAA
jgi:large subunit ribosomal protein L31